MIPEADIRAVPARATSEALRFLAGGLREDIPTAIRMEALERAISRCGWRHRLWWALRQGRCVGASLVVPSVGRVGMLSHSPLDAPGVEAESVRAAVAAASHAALGDGLAFVQSLLAPQRRADMAMLAQAGFCKLAELVYMRLGLPAPDDNAGLWGYTWRDYRRYGEEELHEVIVSTYEASADCPRLRGLRPIRDVIASHKAGGVFSPRSWWIASDAGRPAGCILVNDSAASAREAEVVYMGVVRAFRGRRLGEAMVRRAVRWARRRKCQGLRVVVDAANTYAKRIYDRVGFRETLRRVAYILPRGPGEGP